MPETIFAALPLDALAQTAASRSEPQGSDAGYLVSAAMVAAVIIGVSFGAGFYLLAQPTAQIIGGSGPRGGIEITALHSIVFPDLPSGAQSVSVEVELPSSAAVSSLPALTQSSPTARQDPTPGNTNPGQGSASPAAVRMGATFDPAFHSLAGLHHTFADPAHARSWYRRDLDLGGAGVIQAQSTGTVTAICKDGTSFTGTKHYAACRGHGGVQSWGEAPAAINPANLPVVQPAPTAASRRTAPAPAGPGQVWVNTASKVYHCPGTRWYGKTQQGSYMSEAQAQAAGARQDHGTSCSS